MWDFKVLPQCNHLPPKANLWLPEFQPVLGLCPRWDLLGDSFNILLKSIFQEVPWSWGWGIMAGCRAEQGCGLPSGQAMLG